MRATTSSTRLLFKTAGIDAIKRSKHQQLASQLNTSDFLLSNTDYSCLREDFIVLVARVLVHEFKFLAGGVQCHIPHKYSEQMAS